MHVTALKGLGNQMVDATIEIYQTIAMELLPIPAKSHYTFNMRDLAKVFQGISLASPECTRCLFCTVFLAGVWLHSVLRSDVL